MRKKYDFPGSLRLWTLYGCLKLKRGEILCLHFVVVIYTPDPDVIHQMVENIKRNELTGRHCYLYQLLHSSASAHSLSSTRQ